jgi:hypothetical protein
LILVDGCYLYHASSLAYPFSELHNMSSMHWHLLWVRGIGGTGISYLPREASQ